MQAAPVQNDFTFALHKWLIDREFVCRENQVVNKHWVGGSTLAVQQSCIVCYVCVFFKSYFCVFEQESYS